MYLIYYSVYKKRLEPVGRREKGYKVVNPSAVCNRFPSSFFLGNSAGIDGIPLQYP